MILDSSALVAVVLGEPAADTLVRVMSSADDLAVGAPTLVETGMVLAARAGTAGTRGLDTVLAAAGVEILPFTDAHWRTAVQAFERFGKGRHPAALNLGDCFSYASARLARRPLLCLGDDFPQTDLALVAQDDA